MRRTIQGASEAASQIVLVLRRRPGGRAQLVVEVKCEDRRRTRKGSEQPEVRWYPLGNGPRTSTSTIFGSGWQTWPQSF
jgi:hypothetical protein